MTNKLQRGQTISYTFTIQLPLWSSTTIRMLEFWFMRSYAHPIYITEIHSNPSLCTILLFLMFLDLFLFAKGHVKIYIGFLFTSQFASLIIPFIYTNQCTSTKSFQFFSSFQVFLASHQYYYILGKENRNISKNIINHWHSKSLWLW